MTKLLLATLAAIAVFYVLRRVILQRERSRTGRRRGDPAAAGGDAALSSGNRQADCSAETGSVNGGSCGAGDGGGGGD